MNEINIIKVNIADLNVAIAPDKIKTIGLGSCVGIVLYDNNKKIAGLAHILLPTSNTTNKDDFNRAKYANTAVSALLEKMDKYKVNRRNIVAKIAGGSQMFNFKTTSELLNIGCRNIEATKKSLLEHNIPLVAEDTGGNIGRTIEFDPCSGFLLIKTAKQGIKKI